MRFMLRSRLLIAASLVLALPARAQESTRPGERFWLTSAGVVAASLALDAPLRRAAAASRSDAFDDLAPSVDPLGRARFILPALGAAVLLPRALGHRAFSDAAFRVAAGYLAADAVESALKPLVGRHRPGDGGSAWRFHPLARTEEWHSFPSAHTAHAFGIATGVAIESGNRWAAGAAYGAAGLVALQRIYTGAHWTSDVTTSAALSIATSGATVHWLRRRMHRAGTASANASLTLGANRVGVAVSF